jgi:hypothetical protein
MLSGNPLEWAASIKRWDYHPGQAPWQPFFGMFHALWTRPYHFLTTEAMAPYDTLYGLTATVFVVASAFVWRRFGPGYGLFMVCNLALPLSSGVFEGLGRYCSVLFPFSIWLAATVRSATVHGFLLFVMAAIYMWGLSMFVNVHPII